MTSEANSSSTPNWMELFQWNATHLDELRFNAFVFFKEGLYELSESFFEGLSLLEPKEPYHFRMLGVIAMQKNDFNKALVNLEKALELQPEHFGSQINRAKVYFYLGRLQEGLAEARRLALCPEEEIAQDAQALLLAYG